MMPARRRRWTLALAAATVLATLTLTASPTRVDGTDADADADGWVPLTSIDRSLWKSGPGAWFLAGDAKIDPKDKKKLVGEPGTGVIINGPTGRTTNLVTSREFGDVEFHCDFLVPKGSNAGVKFEGLYEIQIFDSYGVDKPTGSDCGGIYPRAQLLPKYHHIDDGYPPLKNACLPPGSWQTLDATFLAPRFDADGKKIANARIVKVVLNGQTVQDNVELTNPTGHAWTKKEMPRGPILLQADHGPAKPRRPRSSRPQPRLDQPPRRRRVIVLDPILPDGKPMRSLVVVHLIALIVSCPFLCGSADVGDPGAYRHRPACCADDQPSAPVHCPDEGTSCFCQGAVPSVSVRSHTPIHDDPDGLPFGPFAPNPAWRSSLQFPARPRPDGRSPGLLDPSRDAATLRALLQIFRC
jgi:hypothetical protein